MSIARLLLFVATISFICTNFAVHQAYARKDPIRFAPLPMENQEEVLTKFQPLTTFLSKYLNADLEYIYSTSYSTILEKFKNSEIDLAYLGPLPYVELRKDFAEALPIIFFKESAQKATYTCAIVTFPDNNFDMMTGSLQTIALTQPLSTCGYLSVNGLMTKHGNSLEKNLYHYVGTHDEVALSVIRGDFQGGGLKTSVAKKYQHMGLYILTETGPLPPFALVANTKTLSQQTIDKIISGLLQLGPNNVDTLDPDLKNIIGNGVLQGDDSAYQTIRDLQSGVSIPEEGNF